MSQVKLATLIPAFNLQYLKESLVGLTHQTYKTFDIIIADDSPNLRISDWVVSQKALGKLEKLNIRLIKGGGGPRQNHHLLDDKYYNQYDLIHFHLDDDYIYPTFYEKHVAAHKTGDFSVSISQRWIANGQNVPITAEGHPAFIENNLLQYTPLTHSELVKISLPKAKNWMGELTNMVFKTNGSRLIPRGITAENLTYFGLLDIGTYLSVTTQKPAVWLSGWLSNFRQHSAQTTHWSKTRDSRIARLCWLTYGIKAYRENLLSEQEFLENVNSSCALVRRGAQYDPFLLEPLSLIDGCQSISEIDHKFIHWWVRFLKAD